MEFEQFLKDNAVYLSIAVFVLIAFVLLLYLIVPRIIRHKKIAPVETAVDPTKFYTALGGHDNVKSLELNGSRLSVELQDVHLPDRDMLKELGVIRVITMKSKLVLLVDSSFQQLIEKK